MWWCLWVSKMNLQDFQRNLSVVASLLLLFVLLLHHREDHGFTPVALLHVKIQEAPFPKTLKTALLLNQMNIGQCFFFLFHSFFTQHTTWRDADAICRRSRRCWRRLSGRRSGERALSRAAAPAPLLIYLCRNLLARISRRLSISELLDEPARKAWDLWLYLWVFTPTLLFFINSRWITAKISLYICTRYFWGLHIHRVIFLTKPRKFFGASTGVFFPFDIDILVFWHWWACCQCVCVTCILDFTKKTTFELVLCLSKWTMKKKEFFVLQNGKERLCEKENFVFAKHLKCF